MYVSVLGKHKRNGFSIIIWDMIFEQDEYTIQIRYSNDTTGGVIIELEDEIQTTDARLVNFCAHGTSKYRYSC